MASYFLIECKVNGISSYYARGIFLRNIPIEKADSVHLLKCTHKGHLCFQHDCMPAFRHFQRLWKAWYRLIRNPRTYLLREIGSLAIKRFSPRKHLQ